MGVAMDFSSAKKTIDSALSKKHLLICIGNCIVKYKGRAASKLSEGDRLLIVKHDGTFLIHQSTGMKAINYQGPGAFVSVIIMDENAEKESS